MEGDRGYYGYQRTTALARIVKTLMTTRALRFPNELLGVEEVSDTHKKNAVPMLFSEISSFIRTQ